MADPVDQNVLSLPDFLVSKSSPVVHYISIVCAIMGIIALLPLIVFVVYDLVLWVWRLLGGFGTSSAANYESRPEPSSSSPPVGVSTARRQRPTARRKR